MDDVHGVKKGHVFQVMEKAELLRDTDANILPAFIRLQELVRKCSNPCVLSIKWATWWWLLLCMHEEEEGEELL